MKNLKEFNIYDTFLPNDIFNNLKDNIHLNLNKLNITLAGNIENEFDISFLIDQKLNQFIINKINNSLMFKEYIKDIQILNKNLPFKIGQLWVNFQKKHEFNPIHNHTGIFSFIIFIKIPYNLDDELKKGPGRNSNTNASSQLCFILNSCEGKLMPILIPVDKSYEQGMYIFPSSYNHLVYPFYTSDDFRITISGNIMFYAD